MGPKLLCEHQIMKALVGLRESWKFIICQPIEGAAVDNHTVSTNATGTSAKAATPPTLKAVDMPHAPKLPLLVSYRR